jgi:tRNA-2-methylthio-N6-dimethylallyladenosine synthase
MDDQVPEDVLKDRFNRLLLLVQNIGREQTARFEGQVKEVLVEHINEQDPGLVTGRMDNNSVVHFPGDASLIGQIVKVKLDKCHGFYYLGTQA